MANQKVIVVRKSCYCECLTPACRQLSLLKVDPEPQGSDAMFIVPSDAIYRGNLIVVEEVGMISNIPYWKMVE